MNFRTLLLLLLAGSPIASIAQVANPWLDSTQVNKSIHPVYVVNGIIVNPTEINVDFIHTLNVTRDQQINKWLGNLARNGCVYVDADQQFDVITPQAYRLKKNVLTQVGYVFYMLNGCIVSDTIRISKASIRKVDILSGANRTGASADTYCLSLWTLTDEERELPKSKRSINIRGIQHQAATK